MNENRRSLRLGDFDSLVNNFAFGKNVSLDAVLRRLRIVLALGTARCFELLPLALGLFALAFCE